MKDLIIGLLSCLSFTLNAQDMISPKDVVTKLFVSTDNRDWDAVKSSFSDSVLLDYSSMNSNPATKLTPKQIITAWKGTLPDFEFTHHQLGNIISTQNAESAHVFCYGTASHYLSDKNGNLWIVVGTYDFDLVKEATGSWKISSMKFNFKYQDGNTALPEKAMNQLK